MIKEKILTKAEEYKEDLFKFLRDMIRIPSTSCNEEELIKRIVYLNVVNLFKTISCFVSRIYIFPQYDVKWRTELPMRKGFFIIITLMIYFTLS